MILNSEFASVEIDRDDSGNGPRLLIRDARSGKTILLDPLELASLGMGAPRRVVAVSRSRAPRSALADDQGRLHRTRRARQADGDNLAKASDFDLTVYDVRREPVDELVALGARRGSSPLEVARSCDVIEVIVVDDTQVETVVLGDDGILAGARPQQHHRDSQHDQARDDSQASSRGHIARCYRHRRAGKWRCARRRKPNHVLHGRRRQREHRSLPPGFRDVR